MTKPKALILAGGRGERLSPITDDIPKPLLPVGDRAVMSHTLKRLYGEGITDVAVTLGYLGNEIIKYFEENGTEGTELTYYTESEPLGTAGSAHSARGFFDGDFLCIGGDTLLSFDLMPAVSFHKKVGALATLIVSRSDEPCRYGSVIFDKNGKITSFSEKPAWKNVRTDVISTGIYVLSPRIFDFIRPGKMCDFAKDVFPNIVGGALYAYETDGSFCDIGTPGAYLKANLDVCRGDVPGTPPCECISQSARISPSAHISRSVVLDGAVIGEGCVLSESIMCRGAVMMKNSTAKYAVIPPGDVVRTGSAARENLSIRDAFSKYDIALSKIASARMASSEQAEEIAPSLVFSVSGSVKAPFGAARTVGEMMRRGAKSGDGGVILEYDVGRAEISCVDISTLNISATSSDQSAAADVFNYAKNSVNNLF